MTIDFPKFRKLLCHLRELLSGPCRIDYINGSDTFPPPLSKEEEQEVFAQLHAGSTEARETLIVHNLRLVVYIAKKFESSGLGLEDLISIGTIGLIKAVETFCPEKKIKLATYASRCIENEILMVLRKNAQLRGEISIDEPLSADWDGIQRTFFCSFRKYNPFVALLRIFFDLFKEIHDIFILNI